MDKPTVASLDKRVTEIENWPDCDERMNRALPVLFGLVVIIGGMLWSTRSDLHDQERQTETLRAAQQVYEAGYWRMEKRVWQLECEVAKKVDRPTPVPVATPTPTPCTQSIYADCYGNIHYFSASPCDPRYWGCR